LLSSIKKDTLASLMSIMYCMKKKGKKKERFIEEKRVEDRGYYDSPLDRGPKFEDDERDRKFKEKHKEKE